MNFHHFAKKKGPSNINKDLFESFDLNLPDFQIKNRQVYAKKL
jgi:hypothetical protein